MNEREMEEAIELLHQYFDQANPEDAVGNIRLIKRLAGMQFSEIAGRLLMLAPPVILDGLQNLVQAQTARSIFGRANEDLLDSELQAVGLALVMEYAHLIQAAGSGGVMAVTTMLPWLARDEQDDAIAILALALTFLLRAEDPLTQLALESALESAHLRPVYDQVYNTSARVALAYLLFERNQRDLFQREAVPMLAIGPQRRQLESLLKPGNPQLHAWVLGAVLLEIASAGQALVPEAGWRRRR